MFKRISSDLVNKAIQRDVVKADNQEEYIYGINAFLTTIFNIASALAIGFFMNMTLEIVLFVIVYKSLRKYVGGSHSKNAKRCYLSSCVTYIAALCVIKYYPISAAATTPAVIICAAVIFVIAPIEAEKKPLDEIEKIVFGRRSKISIAVWVGIYLVLCFIPNAPLMNHCAVVVAVSIAVVTIFAAEGKIYQLTKK